MLWHKEKNNFVFYQVATRLVLLLVGFALPIYVAIKAVRSYRYRFSLTNENSLAVYFLLHFP